MTHTAQGQSGVVRVLVPGVQQTPTIRLTEDELMAIAAAGVVRRVRAISRGRPQAFGCRVTEALWERDIIGTIGEYAVSRVVGLPWRSCSDVDTLHGDLDAEEARVQVRSTGYADGHLIVEDSDHDADVFALAVVQWNEVRVPGWIVGADAKSATFRKDTPRGAKFYVPQHRLRPVEDLRRRLGRP
jgi:hypothetical protein